MHDWLSWSIPLGRWGGLRVRLHVLFVVLALVVLHLAGRSGDSNSTRYALIGLGILLASVLLHELGHAYAARRLGGGADQIMLWPLGGLIPAGGVHDVQSELVVALAGPLVNWIVCLVTIPMVIMSGWADLGGLFNPLSPPSPADGLDWNLCVALVFWMNWVLAGINLLPAYPMDGIRILRSLLRPTFGYRASCAKTARLAKFTALALFIFALLVYTSYPSAWIPLALLAIFLFFSAKEEDEKLRHEDMDDELFGYDFSQGYTSLERTLDPPVHSRPGPLRRWLERRRKTKLRRKHEVESEEDSRVDGVLARLHDKGLDGLSSEDLALLKRVGSRYKSRQRP